VGQGALVEGDYANTGHSDIPDGVATPTFLTESAP